MCSRNVGFDASGNDIYYTYTKRCELNAKRVREGMEGGFRGVVRGTPRVGHQSSYGSCLYNGALRLKQERRKFLAHAHDGKHICLEEFMKLVLVVVKRGHDIIAASVVI